MSSSSSSSNPDHAAQEALRLLGPAPANWVPAHAGIDHNVVVVGGETNGYWRIMGAGYRKSVSVDEWR